MTHDTVANLIRSIEDQQRDHRAKIRAVYFSGMITQESRGRARLTFGLLRSERGRLLDWLRSHPD